jgi:hypothetical protein
MASGKPTDVTSPAKALHMGVIRKLLGSMRLKNRSTSQGGSKVGMDLKRLTRDLISQMKADLSTRLE